MTWIQNISAHTELCAAEPTGYPFTPPTEIFVDLPLSLALSPKWGRGDYIHYPQGSIGAVGQTGNAPLNLSSGWGEGPNSYSKLTYCLIKF